MLISGKELRILISCTEGLEAGRDSGLRTKDAHLLGDVLFMQKLEQNMKISRKEAGWQAGSRCGAKSLASFTTR